jgi:hypothetical protein
MKICLKQWQKPSSKIKVKVPGMGDCQKCTPGPDNKDCIGYCPLTVCDAFYKEITNEKF